MIESGFFLLCLEVSKILFQENNIDELKNHNIIENTVQNDKNENKVLQKDNNQIIKYGFKDDLFKKEFLRKSLEGYDIISYNQVRDLEDVDEIDVDKSYGKYVSLELKDKENFKTFQYGGNIIPYYEISGGNKFLIIFIHGLNGNATWGFKDWTFGGNFNRIKHLSYYNGGIYISPTIKNFGRGAKEMGGLIQEYLKQNKDMKIFVACGSSGGETCWKIYDDTSIKLDGLLLLGSMPPFLGLKQLEKRNIPIYYGHGEKDKSMSVNGSIRVFNKLNELGRKHKLEVFTNGVHGTPLRMIDWLKTLQFLFNEEGKEVQDKSIGIKEPEHFSGIKEIYPNGINLKTI